MLSKLSEQENSVFMKKLLKWIKELLTHILTGLSTTLSKEHQIDKQALWLTWENNKWTNTFKPLKEDITITKLWLKTLFNLFYFQMFREVVWQRKYSSSKEDSNRQQRNRYTQHSQKLQQKWCNDCINSYFLLKYKIWNHPINRKQMEQ